MDEEGNEVISEEEEDTGGHKMLLGRQKSGAAFVFFNDPK